MFEKEVHLSKVDEKIHYKFVVDDQWIVDENAPKEDDGHNNVNNLLLPDQIKKDSNSASGTAAAQNEPRPTAHRILATSSSPPGSFSGANPLNEAPTVSAGGNGAPLLSEEQSRANLNRWVPHVNPDPNRPVTRSLAGGESSSPLPQSDGASASKVDDEIPGAFPQTPANENTTFGVSPLPATGHHDTESSATTSKEAYDNAGGEGTAGGSYGILPVMPPTTTGLGSGATTSKEDYDKVGSDNTDNQAVSVNPLPATGHENIQSSVTTTKEEYEKAGALGAAGAAVAGIGAAIGGVFSRPKSDDKNIIPESSLPMNPGKTDTMDTGPTMRSSGPGTTTADLASKVPLEPKREATVVDESSPQVPDPAGVEAPVVSKQASATPFINSAGAGTTTAALASQVPLEQKRQGMVIDEPVSPEVAQEKSAVENELLSKVPTSQATGEPASAAKSQTSYYGMATAVPEPVEQSFREAHAAPEAAAEPAVVAEKSELERELQQKVPVVDSAGEPAPTISAATATSAPSRTTASATVADLTDGKTANEPVPDTDTGDQARGISAGEIAGGAAVGGAAAAGAAALASKHEDRDIEPPRVADSQKPNITTESTPFNAATTAPTTATTTSRTSGLGAASPHPGVSPAAGAALSDGTEDPTIADEPSAPRPNAPVERSEATATEYAPPRAGGLAPGVSPNVAAALSDGTEDPTLSEEPAVKMMNQNDAAATEPFREGVTQAHEATTTTGTIADTIPSETAAQTKVGMSDQREIAATEPFREGITQAHEATTTTGTIANTMPLETAAQTTVGRAGETDSAATEPFREGVTQAHEATTTMGTATDTKPVEKIADTTAGPVATGASGTSTSADKPAAPEAAETGTGFPLGEVTNKEAPASTGATTTSALTDKPAAPGAAETGTGFPLGEVENKDTPASSSKPIETKTTAPETPKKTTAGASSAASTPAKGTPESNTAGDKKKKRHRLSAFIKKLTS